MPPKSGSAKLGISLIDIKERYHAQAKESPGLAGGNKIWVSYPCYLQEIERLGLVQRKSRYQSAGGQTSNEYDLIGLIIKLKTLAKEELKERNSRDDADARKRREHGIKVESAS